MKCVIKLALITSVILLSGGSLAKAAETDAAVIEQRLEKPITAEFTETALQDVLNHLADTLEVQFHIKQRVLAEAGIETSAVTMNLKDVSAKTVLDLVLQDVSSQLDYEIRDGFVLVSTKEDLDSLTTVRVYNCRDLLRPAAKRIEAPAAAPPGVPHGPGATAPTPVAPTAPTPPPGTFAGGDMASGAMMGSMGGGMGGRLVVANSGPASQLVNMLQNAVEAQSWDVSGGPGNVSEFNGLLVVKHSARVQAKVAELLEMLRQASEDGAKPQLHE